MFSKPIYNSPLCSCIICKHVTSAKGIHSHHRVVHSEDGKKSHAEASKKGSVAGALATSKKYKQLKDAEIDSYEKSPNSCEQCGIHLSFESRHNRFCSQSCSATNTNTGRHQSNETKQKISSGVKKYLNAREKPPYTKIEFCTCKYCNKKFVRKQEKGISRTWCSDECKKLGRSLIARNNPGLGTKRSKQEIELYNLCKDHFGETAVTNNEKIFNGWGADILIYDHRIAILWNGPWHYKEMGFSNHSLKQVQNRDIIKIKEIYAMGWTPIVFEDRYYTPKSAFTNLLSLL